MTYRSLSKCCSKNRLIWTWCLFSSGLALSPSLAQDPATDKAEDAALQVAEAPKQISDWVVRYTADMRTLDKRYRVPLDQTAVELRAMAMQEWLDKLAERDFESLDRVAQTDYLLLRSEIEYQLAKLRLDNKRDQVAAKHLPFAAPLVAFLKAREEVEAINPSQVAETLNSTAAEVEQLTRALQNKKYNAQVLFDVDDLDGEVDGAERISQAEKDYVQQRLDALRASELLQSLSRSLREANGFYEGYDPLFSWWAKQPVQRLTAALEKYRVALREKIVGVADADQETIIGLPIGRDGLALELKHEWIAHDPAELIQLANREMDWCEEQMAEASAELGFGDDWRAALEHVKAQHVQPGAQPQMIRELAWEAIRFLEAHDLITIPPLAANGWTMTMMSPERQRVNPYFLGGDSIIVSFPTDDMTQEEKMMSMRSNNEHFARATVHHELIPGHHLQYYMLPRYRPYRSLFATPFWMEGWALYWEMLLWDMDFAHGPEDRVGMLFWRKHRCARIIFSLSYHLGTMSPEQCVDYLVERVGHERSAATAEVRRSIMGGYSPLYQAAYMLGGLQLRSLHKELVLNGNWTNRRFHDAVLHEHSIPIEVLRIYLTDQPVTRDTVASWQFADAP